MKKHKRSNAECNIAAMQAMYRTAPSSADFHNNCYEVGDKKLWDECVAEEKAENERALAPIRAAQDKLNKTFIAALGNELMTLPNDPFLAEHCKQTETANALEDIASAFLEFRETMLPTVITDAGIALLERITMQNLGVDWASTSPLTFSTLWARLESLGLVKEGMHYTAVRPTERTQEPQALNDREQCEADWQAQYYPLWEGWLASMKKSFGFTPNQAQQRYALDVISETGMSPLVHETFNEVRRICCRKNVFPPMWTEDELLAEQLSHSNLNDPRARANYIQEANRIRFQSSESPE